MHDHHEHSPIALELWPDRAMYHPGEVVTLHLAIANTSALPREVSIAIQVMTLATTIHAQHLALTLPPGPTSLTVPLTLPQPRFQGYGIDVQIMAAHDHMALATASTAVDVLTDWTQAPRYGFLADFAPEAADAATVVAQLNRYHINVAQFYDWMWRHYALMPPTPSFTDALGRAVSLDTVRARIAACHAHNIATMGYAAVYGAEPEYALNHPAEMLYDAAGEPYTLEGLFNIMNIHRDNPWRQVILDTMVQAVVAVPFDGLHLDQYGFPTKEVFGPAPERRPYDLADDFPGFIDEARAVIQQLGETKRVIFNAVRNWPIDAVAATDQDAIYIEVWPPYETYGDLQQVIAHAHALDASKQVIIAAYMKPLRTCAPERFAEAMAATRLTTATIWANGGFHLLLGEHDAALQDAYYPDNVTLSAMDAATLRRYWDFVVRYEAVLSDRRFHLHPDATAVTSRATPLSTQAEAGTIWAIPRQMLGYTTVSLINFMQATQMQWNAPAALPQPSTALPLRIRLAAGEHVTDAFVASPDDDGRPHQLDCATHQDDDGCWAEVVIPHVEYWQLLVLTTVLA